MPYGSPMFDNLDQLSQPALSPLQSMLLGGAQGVEKYANPTDRPTSPWAALAALAGGMGGGLRDQRADALKQLYTAAQTQKTGLEAQGQEDSNKLAEMTLDTYRRYQAKYGTAVNKAGVTGAAVNAGGAVPAVQAGTVPAVQTAQAGGPVAPAPAAPTPAVGPTSDYAGKVLDLSNDDIEGIARVAHAEDASNPESVVRTITNRLAHGGFGNSIDDILNGKNQFEPVGKAGGDWRKMKPATSAQIQATKDALNNIILGKPDPTKGGTYFLNRDIAQQRGTDYGAGNDQYQTAKIGQHTFYGPNLFAVGGDLSKVPDYRVRMGGQPAPQTATAPAAVPPPAPAAPGVLAATNPPAAGAAASPDGVPVFDPHTDIDIIREFSGSPGGEKIVEAAKERLQKMTPEGSYLGVDPQSGKIGLFKIPGYDKGKADTAGAVKRGESDVQLEPAPASPGVQAGVNRQFAGAQSEAAGKDAGNQANQNVAYTQEWRTRFDPTINKARELNKQVNSVNLALDRQNGPGDIAAITAFNKLLDEGVSVHESDIKNTVMGQSLAEQLNAWVKNKTEGDMLDQPLRDKIRELSMAIHKSSNEYYRVQVESFRPAIESQGLNYEHIMPKALREQLRWADPPAGKPTHIWTPGRGVEPAP